MNIEQAIIDAFEDGETEAPEWLFAIFVELKKQDSLKTGR